MSSLLRTVHLSLDEVGTDYVEKGYKNENHSYLMFSNDPPYTQDGVMAGQGPGRN